MAKKRKFRSVDDKCRVCLGNDGCMSDIFSDDLRPKIDDLGDSTSVHIDDDENLPRNICHVCLYKLDMWIEFRKQFLRTNAMLREHLGVDEEISDNATSMTKRKHSDLQDSQKDDSIEHGAAKKIKSEETMTTTTTMISEDCVEASCETIEKNSTTFEPMSIEDNSAKNISSKISTTEQHQHHPENPSTLEPELSSVKPSISRRVKTTERRKASTKRWVARKKALLLATGENETDTDSVSSSDEQSPSDVQKVRTFFAADSIGETRKRISESSKTKLKNIDENSTDDKFPDLPKNNDETKDSISEGTKNLIEPKDNIAKDFSKNCKQFLPNSVRSELTIDDVTFIVTSTLILTQPHRLNPVKITKDTLPSTNQNDEIQTELNTDIIDAVQLRRVCPKNSATSQTDKKLVERCLNIEVEGTELEALQRVQQELANFVETKLFKDDVKTIPIINNEDDTGKSKFQTLEQQLKTIVEKSIKRNILSKSGNKSKEILENRGNNTFTGEFVKAAMRSKIFQPRVVIIRYEPPKKREKKACDEIVPKIEKITDSRDILKKQLTLRTDETKISIIPELGKRRSVKPAKYADYEASLQNPPTIQNPTMDENKEVTKKIEPSTRSNKFKTYGPSSKSVNSTINNETITERLKIHEITGKSILLPKNPSNIEKHICGVCGDSFSTRREIEQHFVSHKKKQSTVKQMKQKMMRCKRCHAIVEARFVKLHVCDNSAMKQHKCCECDATFRNDKLLVKHMATHSKNEEKIAITANEENETGEAIVKNPKIPANKTKNLSVGVGQNKETYTCFVCDKIFEGEEVLKDHLQKHCDDMSDEEIEAEQDNDDTVNDKELYQCAICSETMESEDKLEIHVEKHLFDDDDDNPNLITIGPSDETTKQNDEAMIHGCQQCMEKFDSEMLLMLHMQAHEEEIAIAEWERRGVDTSQVEQHICVICDELFATETELSEHLDIHNGNAHVCLLCDKPFITLEELQTHVNSH